VVDTHVEGYQVWRWFLGQMKGQGGVGAVGHVEGCPLWRRSPGGM
jgi:hypothetical protein